MNEVSFTKMHGIGNDFVIVDLRDNVFSVSTEAVMAICDRHKGIGCDQFVVIESSNKADCLVSFYNPDGSKSGACGNATRCVAYLIMEEYDRLEAAIETSVGVLQCHLIANKIVSVNMGPANLEWDKIPLAHEIDTLHLKISEGKLSDPVAVNMGNPHAVFFVEDIDDINLEEVGPLLENNPIFPERANIGIVQVISKDAIALRVWERGTGETLACGSGACAAMVAAFRRKLTGNVGTVVLRGGEIRVEIQENGDVFMAGAVEEVFTGVFDESFIENEA